jgi:hypothetical protein
MSLPKRQKKIQEVKKRYEKNWLSIKGVISVGIGTVSNGKVGIIVSVVSAKPEIKKFIPSEIEGIAIEIAETWELTSP